MERVLEKLISKNIIKSPNVIKAMKKVSREKFIPESVRDKAYVDSPLPIGHKQTISAIHMVGMMAEALELQEGDKVLEIGAGSGYHAAVISEIVSPKDTEKSGHVYTVEIVPNLVDFAIKNLESTGYSKNTTVVLGDGSKGYPEHAPYDKILVTAAAPNVPEPLIKQLKVGGVIVIPTGGLRIYQYLLRVRKVSENKIIKENLGGVLFVPLIGEHGWKI